MNAAARFAPEFALRIDGEPLPQALRSRITSLSLQTGLEGADRVELELADEQLQGLDDRHWAIDRELALDMGWAPAPLSPMFVGEIVAQGAAFPSSGMPTVSITAQDRRRRLQRGSRARWFAQVVPQLANVPLPDVAVAAAVAGAHGLMPITDPVGAALAVLLGGAQLAIAQAQSASDPNDPDKAQKSMRIQSGESDLDFLARIARENGWDMAVDHGAAPGGRVLRFMSPADRLDAQVEVAWGRDLIEFHPRLSEVGQIAAVTVHVWQPALQTTLAVTVGWDWDRQSLTLKILPAEAAAADDQPRLTIADRPVTLADAPRTLLGELLPRLNRRLTAHGALVGDARVRAGAVLRVMGVGERFGGLYRVTSAEHRIDGGGWTTRFEARKDVWFGSVPLPEQGAVPVRPAM